ncbi:MAG: 16S rRNA (cytosine(1402)-N(4))-methyltransferase RsmH [Candidatus Acetothermia bacterium]
MIRVKRSDSSPPLHEPVMVEEVLNHLAPGEKPNDVFLDGTTSTGGHAAAIAEKLGADGTLIGLDLDETALEVASQRLKKLSPQIKLYRGNYRDMESAMERAGVEALSGVLFDLGFSTFQIEDPERGFSFQSSGPLDMRMDSEGNTTAEEIVNEYSFEALKDLILRYGEERWADGIAKEIVKKREEERITTTDQLVNVIKAALPEGERWSRKIHPATRTFQALRIAVNDELTNLEEGLEAAYNSLEKGGVMVVIAYHSLEDRRVKRFLAHKEEDCTCPPDLPICRCEAEREIEITANGITPDEKEIEENPRSRSARLRAGRKLASKER